MTRLWPACPAPQFNDSRTNSRLSAVWEVRSPLGENVRAARAAVMATPLAGSNFRIWLAVVQLLPTCMHQSLLKSLSSALRVTGAPRLTASLRVSWRADKRVLAWVVVRLLAARSVKLGTARPAKTASTATVMASSTMVKPAIPLALDMTQFRSDDLLKSRNETSNVKKRPYPKHSRIIATRPPDPNGYEMISVYS